MRCTKDRWTAGVQTTVKKDQTDAAKEAEERLKKILKERAAQDSMWDPKK